MVCRIIFRLAQALAGSFNFQGRIQKTFYVLVDGKTTTGPRSINQGPGAAGQAAADANAVQPMETDGEPSAAPLQAPSGGQSLASKLSAKLANKRKATEPADLAGASDKTKSRR
jgi:hypothetical protein